MSKFLIKLHDKYFSSEFNNRVEIIWKTLQILNIINYDLQAHIKYIATLMRINIYAKWGVVYSLIYMNFMANT